MNEYYSYSQEEESLPEFSGKGVVLRADKQYLSQSIAENENPTEFLNQKLIAGWTLVSVDNGIGYFERSGFFLYEKFDDGSMVRFKPGGNS